MLKLKIKGLILALKDLGAYLATWTASGVKADPYQFCWSLFVFMLINIPADLYLLNHWTETKK